jgi:2,4-dienoyl-CoA reductase-like NADH-dependent reductase (Old Yellow Enzyme family)/thioredoxin reductase
MSKKIFEPFEINGMTIKNRLGFAPMLNMPDVLSTFTFTDRTVKWFEERAKGGTGLVMSGTLGPWLFDIPGSFDKIAEIAEKVHAHGAKFGVQVGDGGIIVGQGPSPMPYPDEKDPKISIFEYLHGEISPFPGVEGVAVLPAEELPKKMELFAALALKLKELGVDCVELHCAHGGATLYCAFISPFYNRREDEYGGSWENRLRFPTGTIKKMRAAVGDNYPLLVRLSASELLGDRGITLKDTTDIIVPAMEAAGVDCFDISQGSIVHAPEGITIPLYYPRGCYIHHAEAVKKATKLPVIGVGRIVDLDMADQFLEEEKADIIYMGRQLTSDPETPNKYLEGRSDEIRKCIGCLEGCGTPCPINYDISPDALPLETAGTSKKVLIIGGGVAGMEAARVCALRGHDVTLVEKAPQLGGTVAALALDPLAAEFQNFVDYLVTQMDKRGVHVRLGKGATPADIEAINPDAVIVATGASLIQPDMADGKSAVMDHVEALKNRDKIGKRVVVWGLMYGAEFAISLASEGRQVTLIGEGGEKSVSSHAADARKWWALKKIADIDTVRATPESQRVSNPEVFFNTKVEGIAAGEMTIKSKDGDTKSLSYDTLVISRGRKKNDEIFDELQGKIQEIYKIGDCLAAGNIQRAVWSANEAARKI